MKEEEKIGLLLLAPCFLGMLIGALICFGIMLYQLGWISIFIIITLVSTGVGAYLTRNL